MSNVVVKAVIKSIKNNPSKWIYKHKESLAFLKCANYFINEETNLVLVEETPYLGGKDYYIGTLSQDQSDLEVFEVKGFINFWKINGLFLNENYKLKKIAKENELKRIKKIEDNVLTLLRSIQ
jgi:hypothetical protein